MHVPALLDMLLTYSLAFTVLASMFPRQLLRQPPERGAKPFGLQLGGAETVAPLWLLAVAVTLHLHAATET